MLETLRLLFDEKLLSYASILSQLDDELLSEANGYFFDVVLLESTLCPQGSNQRKISVPKYAQYANM